MTIHDGFVLGVGICAGFMLCRFPIALILHFMEKYIEKLREVQAENRRKIAALNRFQRTIERTLGRDPDTK